MWGALNNSLTTTYRKRKTVTLQWRCAIIKINIISNKACWYHRFPDLMQQEGHIISAVFSPQNHKPSLITRKHQTNPRDILQNTCLILFKSVKIWKTEKLRSFHRWEETKETCQVNTIWSLLWIFEQTKTLVGKLVKSKGSL